MSNDNNNTISDSQMKKWRFVGTLNIIVGGIVLVIQIATLVSLYDWVDWVGIGIWGGCFMISAGSLTIQRSPRLISMSVLALLSGLALVIFYSVNLGVIDQTYYCWNGMGPNNSDLCDWRLASDIIFVVFGSIAIVINIVLTANASSIMVVRQAVRYPVRVNAYPMTATNTTYVVTTPTAYPVSNQTVYQVPVATYPAQTTGVVYQTSPGYYTTGQPQPQQPIYYPQPTNPPPYPT